jgi:predicted  nucleic acid-binding Zn-ribbon protein
MSNKRNRADVDFDPAALEEWLDQTAEKKSISRSELIDQMLSSYWIIEEGAGMMDPSDTDMEHPSDTDMGEAVDRSLPRIGQGDDEAGEDNSEQDIPQLLEEIEALRSAILEHEERLQTVQANHGQGPQGRAGVEGNRSTGPGASEGQITELRRSIDELSSRVTNLEVGGETPAEGDVDTETAAELEAKIADIETKLATHGEAVEAERFENLQEFAEGLEDGQNSIKESLRDLGEGLAQLEDSQLEIGQEVNELRSEQVALEEQIDEEFDGVERVLQHLIDKTENLEYRVGAIAETHEEDLEPVSEHLERKERLRELQAEAQRKDISTAVCDHCDGEIDISLLSDPNCPSCDRENSGLKRAGLNPFRNHVFETGDTRRSLDGENPDTDLGSDVAGSNPARHDG